MLSAYKQKVAERQKHLHDFCAETFAERSRCVLDIGCGHGHWLTAYATAHPKSFCFGMDLRSRRIALARQKQEKNGLTNLVFHKAEAMECLACLPDKVAFDAVFILFPDPWPKKRHHKNRLMQPTFLEALKVRMAPQSQLYFRTDDLEYFTWTQELLQAHPDWEISYEPWDFESSTYFQHITDAAHSLTACMA